MIVKNGRKTANIETETENKIFYQKNTLHKVINRKISEELNRVNLLKGRMELFNPSIRIVNEYARIMELKNSLNRQVKLRISKEKERLSGLNSLLLANNPLKVLNKGYSIIEDEESNVISSVKVLEKTEMVNITLKDGKIKAKLNCL